MTLSLNLRRRLAMAVLMLFAALSCQNPVAAEGQRCAGIDLVAKMATEDPAGYREVLAAAAEVPAGDHLFWRIAGTSSRPDSFIFGTIHYSDDRVADLAAPVREALVGAKVVALELAGMPSPGDFQAALRANPKLLAMPAGKSLYELLAPAVATALKAKLTAAGVDIDQAAALQPWFLAVLLGSPQCERARQAAGELPVDGVVIKIASEKGISRVGLETLPEQLGVMASMPLEAQAAQLTQVVMSPEKAEDRYVTLLRLYLDRRIGMMFPLMEIEGRKNAGLGKAVEHLTETLIARRNRNMIERALPLIEAGGVFIAVGALHLPGPQGLVELLRARGYKVAPAD